MALPELNFPPANVKLKTEEGRTFIWDIIRKKWLVLTPEEWVRQHTLHFFINSLGYPASNISVEQGIKINQLQRRADLIIYKNNQPKILVECKAPNVKLDKEAFHQACRYNLTLKVPFIFTTNGKNHWAAKVEEKEVSFVKSFPPYQEL